MFGQFGQKQYYAMGGPGGPPQVGFQKILRFCPYF